MQPPRPTRALGLAICLLGLWAVSPAAADPAGAARDAVFQSTERLLTELHAQPERLRADPALAGALIAEIVGPRVDFDIIGRLLLGRHWQAASGAQRAAFVREFRTLLLRTYARAMVEFVIGQGLRHADIEYLAPIASRDGRRALIRTRIRAPGRAPVAVHYSLRRGAGGWKVYDVSVGAVSLVVTYRTSFAGAIQQRGLDGLIAEIAAHNRQREAGRRWRSRRRAPAPGRGGE